MKATAIVQHQLPEAKATEVQAHIATYLWYITATDFQLQAAHNSANYGWWLRLRHVKTMHKRHSKARDSANDLRVKIISMHGYYMIEH